MNKRTRHVACFPGPTWRDNVTPSSFTFPMAHCFRSLVFRHFLISCLGAACFSAVLISSQVAEAQGLFAGSKGARVAGRGGAYAAKADDLAAVEYNPAGLTKLG